MKYFVTIAGNIGVGKSTLTGLLAQRMGWQPVYEAFEDNPYLSDFYGDMQRWAFQSQVFFLSRRLRQHHELLQQPQSTIQDRSVYEDAQIFARNLHEQGDMSDRDWQSYLDLYDTLVAILTPPHLVIYLQASVATLQQRIARRGREYERGISAEYLTRLNSFYDDWVHNFTLSPVLTIQTDNLDYVRYEDHLDRIQHSIEARLRGKDILTL